MTMNNVRGVFSAVNVSINGPGSPSGRGVVTRVRGFHVGSQGGSGTIHISDAGNVPQAVDFRLWICVSAFDNLQLPDGGVRFPNGVSVSIPASIALTVFVDP